MGEKEERAPIVIEPEVLEAAMAVLRQWQIASDYVQDDMMTEILQAAFKAKAGIPRGPAHRRTQIEE